MRQLVSGPWVIGRLRAALLLVVALAAVVDLLTFVVLVTRDTASDLSPGRPPAPGAGQTPGPAPGPGEVAEAVVQAVADDRCAGLDAMIADDAVLPFSVTRCLEGGTSPVEISDVGVVGVTTTDDTSAATVTLTFDGQSARVIVDLVLVDDTWRVTGIRADPSG